MTAWTKSIDRFGAVVMRASAPTRDPAVERLAVEVGETAEARRMCFVVDLARGVVLGPSGKPIPGAWRQFADLVRSGRVSATVEGGAFVIRNHHGEITVPLVPSEDRDG